MRHQRHPLRPSSRLALLFAGALCLALVHAAPADVHAQAWVQPSGGVYVKAARASASTSVQYDPEGRERPLGWRADRPDPPPARLHDTSLYLYAEVGLSPAVTIQALLPVKRLELVYDGTTYRSEGVGSLGLGLRLDARPLLGLPRDGPLSAAFNVRSTLPTGYTRNAAPSIGTGQADVEATLDVGASLYPAPVYAQAALGYRHRTSLFGLSMVQPCAPGDFCAPPDEPDYDDEWLLALEAGASAGRWALLQVRLEGEWSNLPPEDAIATGQTLATRRRHVRASVGATVYPTRFLGLSVQRYTTAIGRNVVDGDAWFVGLEVKQ